jgi:predicted nucleic acid-binding protein|tara:strand:+ start:1057 stop:1452 length:396 start_codon:yes stop_codon:yes gene_type:complete
MDKTKVYCPVCGWRNDLSRQIMRDNCNNMIVSFPKGIGKLVLKVVDIMRKEIYKGKDSIYEEYKFLMSINHHGQKASRHALSYYLEHELWKTAKDYSFLSGIIRNEHKRWESVALYEKRCLDNIPPLANNG